MIFDIFSLTITGFMYVHWLKSYEGSKWGILKTLCIIKWMNLNEYILLWKNFQNSVVPSLWSVVTFHPVDINKSLVLLKDKYQRSCSEILNAIALLGAKFIYSFRWELSFVFQPWECLNNQNVLFNTFLTMAAVTLAFFLAVWLWLSHVFSFIKLKHLSSNISIDVI